MADYLITVDKQEFRRDNELVDSLDINTIDKEKFHLLKDNKAYNVELVKANYAAKELTISINGNNYDVKIEDEYDQMVKQMGLLSNTTQKLNNIKAPMPGLIVDIMVTVGQEIEEGTPLLVLSAMKMENIILSQGEGIVKSITAKKEDAVEKGQIIIEME
ncbi:acetyl-CoA carboxylase biotin carboxyl carrier protein subunit [uncultured Maribacter sp.]|uniref:acetyl-CoA carboxylase biotin carboxyl carrier protein subunit n=1 Tax=uncultured Maribacter sp. TaxID=431308 RepID=UPI002629E753|nr:acetyl-CoA carboxylase biotin carboxyl carrier protein subunit [uncultured Maribacter sp.]